MTARHPSGSNRAEIFGERSALKSTATSINPTTVLPFSISYRTTKRLDLATVTLGRTAEASSSADA